MPDRPGINFTILLIFVQTLVLLNCFASTLSARLPSRGRRIYYVLLDVAVCATVFLLCKFVRDTRLAYSFIYTILAQTILCFTVFAGSRRYIFLFILFSNVFHAIVLLFSIVFATLAAPLVAPFLHIYYCKIFMNLLLLIPACIAVWRIWKSAGAQNITFYLPNLYWFFLYAVYALLYFCVVYVQDVLLQVNMFSPLTLLLEFGLLAVCVAAFLAFIALCRSYEDKIQSTLMQQQYAIQRAHFSAIQSANESLRSLRHEMKNHMFYMNYLLDKRDYGELERYFRDFYAREYHDLVEVNTGSSIVDAVLHQKIGEAQQQGIRVQDEIAPCDTAGIADSDLCIILSNLLDNAIEGCAGASVPSISIRMNCVKDYLCFIVTNTTARDVLRENPKLTSNKHEKELHGIGLKVIREIVQRYDGSIEFESNDCQFCVKLMLQRKCEMKGNAVPNEKEEAL